VLAALALVVFGAIECPPPRVNCIHKNAHAQRLKAFACETTNKHSSVCQFQFVIKYLVLNGILQSCEFDPLSKTSTKFES